MPLAAGHHRCDQHRLVCTLRVSLVRGPGHGLAPADPDLAGVERVAHLFGVAAAVGTMQRSVEYRLDTALRPLARTHRDQLTRGVEMNELEVCPANSGRLAESGKYLVERILPARRLEQTNRRKADGLEDRIETAALCPLANRGVRTHDTHL